MKYGEKFSALSNALSEIKGLNENTSYKLNANGSQLVKNYHTLISNLEKAIAPLLQPLVKDVNKVTKETAIQMVSSINSNREGNEIFELMTRLDTLTNGGRTPIQGNAITFNQNDKILKYLEKI